MLRAMWPGLNSHYANMCIAYIRLLVEHLRLAIIPTIGRALKIGYNSLRLILFHVVTSYFIDQLSSAPVLFKGIIIILLFIRKLPYNYFYTVTANLTENRLLYRKSQKVTDINLELHVSLKFFNNCSF